MSFLFHYPSNFLATILSLAFIYKFLKEKKNYALLSSICFGVISLLPAAHKLIPTIEIKVFSITESVCFGTALFLYLASFLKRKFFRPELEKVQSRVFLKLPLLGGLIFYAFAGKYDVKILYMLYWSGFAVLLPFIFKLKGSLGLAKSYAIFCLLISGSHFLRAFMGKEVLVYNSIISILWVIGLYFLFISWSKLELPNEK